MVDPYLRIAPGLYCFLPQLNLRQELLLAACLLARRGMLASNSPGLGDASAGCPPTGQVVTCSIDEIIRRMGGQKRRGVEAMQQAETTAWNIFAQLSHLCPPET